MRPFPAPLPTQRAGNGHSGVNVARGIAAALRGTVTYQADPQAVYASESLAQTLRQLEAYGRDGLPVLSGDGSQIEGWITNASVLRAVGGQIGLARPHSTRPTRSADDPQPVPPVPLRGYRVLELTVGDSPPVAGTTLGQVSWPAGTFPVSVLRDRVLQDPDPELALAAGDRISLLAPLTPTTHNGADTHAVPAAAQEES
jgi:CIC family chloride channel protein